MRPTAHQELTDDENESILGTLTHEAWVGLSVEEVASDWYDLSTDISALLSKKNPSGRLVHAARFSSGSIGGEHRKDLKEAIIGSPAAQSNLSVPIAIQQPGTQPQQQPQNQQRRGF